MGNILAEIQQNNIEVLAWLKTTKLKMRSKIISNGVKDNMSPGELTEDLRVVTGRRNGILDKVGFRFPRYGVWYEKGARKGYAGSQKRTRWRRADGSMGSTNPNAKRIMNTGTSPAHPWFNPVLTSEFPKLKDIVAKGQGRMAVKHLANLLMN